MRHRRVDAVTAEPVRTARAVLASQSKSFALAGRLLGRRERDRAALVYAFCRRADDAIDRPAPGQRPADAVAGLRRELDLIYRGGATGDAVVDAFGQVAHACRIPRVYPDELVAGLAMDAQGWRYQSVEDLLRYCYRVAGTVGLMMCHVLGLADDRALVPAVHLGMAMQLTNIARDVEEDWRLGRLYLPADVLAQAGAPADLADRLGGALPPGAAPGLSRAVGCLLTLADRYYASADRGLIDLPWRAALAIRTARLCYAAIGDRVRAAGCNPLAGRAVVPSRTKLALAGRAALGSAGELPTRARRRAHPQVPSARLAFGPSVMLRS